MSILNRVRGALNLIGIEATRANSMTIWEIRLVRLLKQQGVRTVLDVGANDGGYASHLIRWGYKGEIISFEPLPSAWSRLKERAKPYAERWKIAPPMALSNTTGTAEFHEAGNSVSSSLLEMTDIHSTAAPASAEVRTTTVQTRRLDDVLEAADAGPYFLKLDVQGAESMVLEGAMRALKSSVVGVQVEMSLSTLYSGQSSAAELDGLLRSLGFECWDIIPGFRNPKTLRLLQYDGVYFR